MIWESTDDLLTEHAGAGAALVIADPPWRYGERIGEKNAADHYAGLSVGAILHHVQGASVCAAPGARLALWCTFPILAEWMARALEIRPWRYKTGGAWVKPGRLGIGYHWRGHAEPVLIYSRGGPTGRPHEAIRSGHAAPAARHSAKPIEWQRAWIRAWTRPGDLVIDLYGGLGSVGVACALEGRRYAGAEIDPARRKQAAASIAAARTDN